ncbi:hypothetical protein ACWGJ2_12420 [Streptomyces sp. NPDC054796]
MSKNHERKVTCRIRWAPNHQLIDMKTKYKETARGGLAVNVIEC